MDSYRANHISNFDFDYSQEPYRQREKRLSNPPSPGKRAGLPPQWTAEPPSPTISQVTSRSKSRSRPNRQLQYTTSNASLSKHEELDQVGTMIVKPNEFENRDKWGLDCHAMKEMDDLFNSKAMPPPPKPSEDRLKLHRPGSPPKFTSFTKSTPPPAWTPSLHSVSSQTSFAPLLENRSPTRTISVLDSPYESPYGSPMLANRSSRPVSSFTELGTPTSLNASPIRLTRERINLNGYETVNLKNVEMDQEAGTPMSQKNVARRMPIALRGGIQAGLGIFKEKSRATSGRYKSIPAGKWMKGAAETSEYEKKAWEPPRPAKSASGKRIIAVIITIVLLVAIICGAVGGAAAASKNKTAPSTSIKSETPASNGSALFTFNSSEVKAILNNPDYHRIFPGIDYTPPNTQYQACGNSTSLQNNITLDVAVLAQLTPTIRLYSTDCNQTQLLLTAIDQLNYTSTLKVWLGVDLRGDENIDSRQLSQMWDIIDDYPPERFAGILLGDGVLDRNEMSEDELIEQLDVVRRNLTARNVDLPVAASEPGHEWSENLATASDIIIANVNLFRANQTSGQASSWTWDKVQQLKSLPSTEHHGPWPRSIIGEIGWPIADADTTSSGNTSNNASNAVASVSDVNTFMNAWICDSLKNGTSFFWMNPLESFSNTTNTLDTSSDSTLSIDYTLIDSSRKLKAGLEIPDCGGRTVDSSH
ncbi:glycoside hydrolase family 17 protein [Acrodontium crateriforme]|uniref:glucan endo-1,3-beta-D-glucosidase n=1 Tax=Acrodontium crateriforme TaxID=150365 RepID=A0AAQ3LZA3_9PEZI|nr:glycoside hydrolase family 17 protein [Acrodontium crateriforme]